MDITPNTLIVGLLIGGIIIPICRVILRSIKTSYEAAHKPVYKEFKDGS